MIIDFHTHIFPDKIASRTIEALSSSASIPPHSDGTLEGLLSRLGEAGVDIAVNLPVLTKASQLDSIIKFATQINEKSYTGARVISFAGVHPDTEDYVGALDLVKASGIKGIKLHPDYQGTFIDDEKYVKILSYAKKLDLITVTHAGLDGAFIGQEIKCTPVRVLRLLDRLGGYDKLVLAHMGGNELFDKVYSELAGENIYFDTSYVLSSIGKGMFFDILEKHSCDKILFATDSPWQNIATQVDILKSFGLDKDAENKIFCENARALLNL